MTDPQPPAAPLSREERKAFVHAYLSVPAEHRNGHDNLTWLYEMTLAKAENLIVEAEARITELEQREQVLREALEKLLDPGEGQTLGGVILGGWASTFGFTDAIREARAALQATAGEEKP